MAQKKGSKLKKSTSLEEGEDDADSQGNVARGSVHYTRFVTSDLAVPFLEKIPIWMYLLNSHAWALEACLLNDILSYVRGISYEGRSSVSHNIIRMISWCHLD